MNDNPSKMRHVTELARSLGEHFQSVLILCTDTADDGTDNCCHFKAVSGNIYAAEGSARNYLRQLEQQDHGYHAEQGRRDFGRVHGSE
jgi:hypothetical protein